MSKSKEQKPQSIESVKMAAMKTGHRYQLGIVALAFAVLGFIGGYFISIDVVTNAQAKAVSVVTESKTNRP